MTILTIIILILSVVLHEVAHGFTADRLGDPTARMAGRLTANPIKHLDPIGSLLVPLITSMAGFTFGWAKPVPYNPYNLKNKRRDEVLIALAGPASNILIAIIFSLLIRATDSSSAFGASMINISLYIVLINVILAVFNLIPLPPLDGSKVLFSLLPNQYGQTRMMLESYAPIFILIVVMFIWSLVSPIVPGIIRFLTGIPI